MNGTVNYSVEGAKYGISFGTALAIAISYVNNHSILRYPRVLQLALRHLFRSGQIGGFSPSFSPCCFGAKLCRLRE